MIIKADEEQEYFFEEGCFVLEMLNSREDEACSIVRATVEVGETTKWHSLQETVERYVIIAGTGMVEIGEEPPQKVSRGDVVVIPAGCRQRIANKEQSDLQFLAICTPRFKYENYVDLEAAQEDKK